MKKIFLLIPVALITLGLRAQQINDPNVELRDAKNFHGISVSGGFDVYINQGGEEKVAVSASDEKYKENIVVEVKNGILKIYYKDKKFFNKIFDKMKLKAYVSVKTLDQINASGATNILVEGEIKSDKLSINLSGASDLKGGKLTASNLSIDLSGASRFRLSGSASEVNIDASGASDFSNTDFAAEKCDISASGASHINLTVNKEISAHLSGGSHVQYKGAGSLKDVRLSGGSQIGKQS